MLWRNIATAGAAIWLILGVVEPVFIQQGWHECGQLAGVAARSLANRLVWGFYAFLLGSHFIPLRSGGN